MLHTNEQTTILKGEMPSSLGGNSSIYQNKMSGGQGYGFEGKEIRSGVMEFNSYKSGGSRKRRRNTKKNRRARKSRKTR